MNIHVLDPLGDEIPSARIALKDESHSETIAGVADRHGRAHLWAHFSGRYHLTVSAPGFVTRIEEVNLLPSEVLELNEPLYVFMGDTVPVEPEWHLNRDSFQPPELPLPATGFGSSPLRN